MMSLVADYGDSSSSSSSSDSSSDNEDSSGNQLPPPVLNRLPLPNFHDVDNSVSSSPASVFTNPFKEAEYAKQAILEKHVKMVETRNNVRVINGKKICWNYRKGRCRFGHNCKYAHDSDIQKTKEQLDAENEVQQTVLCQNDEIPQPTSIEINTIREEAVNVKRSKKRPGLTQGLVPGKKVMKSYHKQQQTKIKPVLS